MHSRSTRPAVTSKDDVEKPNQCCLKEEPSEVEGLTKSDSIRTFSTLLKEGRRLISRYLNKSGGSLLTTLLIKI